MSLQTCVKVLVIVACVSGVMVTSAPATSVNFVGTHYDVGGTFFPGGSPPYVVVPWRSSSVNNVYAVSTAPLQQYYGRNGYALFATNFSWPNADAIPSNANIPITGTATFPNLYDLPSWVTGTEIIATRLAGGFAYALIDDPRIVSGYRDYNWGDTLSPPVSPPHSQSPYVQLGIITGDPLNGRVDPDGKRDRWSFTVGAGVPNHIRIGVMTDGLDNSSFAPAIVSLRHSGGDYVSTPFMPVQNPGGRNRFVDMSFFDIMGAQPGDTFIMSGEGSGRVAGFSFDVVPEPATLGMSCVAMMVLCVRRRLIA